MAYKTLAKIVTTHATLALPGVVTRGEIVFLAFATICILLVAVCVRPDAQADLAGARLACRKVDPHGAWTAHTAGTTVIDLCVALPVRIGQARFAAICVLPIAVPVSAIALDDLAGARLARRKAGVRGARTVHAAGTAVINRRIKPHVGVGHIRFAPVVVSSVAVPVAGVAGPDPTYALHADRGGVGGRRTGIGAT